MPLMPLNKYWPPRNLAALFFSLVRFGQGRNGMPTTAEWDRDSAQSALDELFQCALRYTGSKEFEGLMRFTARFRMYSPFNALLAHIQMPGASYVAPPHRWARDYDRRIRLGARPIVLLRPGGPVMFAFDVSDTQPLPGAKPLPRHVTDPFATSGPVRVGGQLERTVENAKRDGVLIAENDAGSQSAGQINAMESGEFVSFQFRTRPYPESRDVKVCYELLLNARHSPEEQYATLAHELAHLYCGHLGTPNLDWWPSRCWVPEKEREFEAESVAFLVCSRLGIENPSHEYLSGYLKDHISIPAISLNCVMKSAGLIEQMGQRPLGLRKEKLRKEKERA